MAGICPVSFVRLKPDAPRGRYSRSQGARLSLRVFAQGVLRERSVSLSVAQSKGTVNAQVKATFAHPLGSNHKYLGTWVLVLLLLKGYHPKIVTMMTTWA